MKKISLVGCIIGLVVYLIGFFLGYLILDLISGYNLTKSRVWERFTDALMMSIVMNLIMVILAPVVWKYFKVKLYVLK
jgi:uncharacterized membrane protein